MNYKEFRRQLGKAGISIGTFADLLKMNRNSITNYAKAKEVPSHLAVIAVLMGEMAENGIDFCKVLKKIKIRYKKVRGKVGNSKFAGASS